MGDLTRHVVHFAGPARGHELARCDSSPCHEARRGGRWFFCELFWDWERRVLVVTRECAFTRPARHRNIVVISPDPRILEHLPDIFPGAGLFPRDLGLYASVALHRGTERKP